MSTIKRVTLFGVSCGLVWSVIAAGMGNLFQSSGAAVTVCISGILTGVLISLALKSPLQSSGLGNSFLFDVVPLPAGAFAFGVILSVVDLAASKITGIRYQAIEPAFSPFQTGAMFALVSVVSLFAVVLFPIAIITTFILRVVIHKRQNTA